MDDESGDDDRDGLTSKRDGLRQGWLGWRNESRLIPKARWCSGLVSVSGELQQYSSSSTVVYYQLLRLQKYQCVQLNFVLLSLAYTSRLAVINNIRWCVASRHGGLSNKQTELLSAITLSTIEMFTTVDGPAVVDPEARYWSKNRYFCHTYGVHIGVLQQRLWETKMVKSLRICLLDRI